jgi:eukaryotic-like serine/threonine-protein kinase
MTSRFATGHSSGADLTNDQTAQVLEILERYLSDLEQGKQVSPDELAARHPEIADVLQAYFKKLNTLHRAATGLGDSGPAGAILPASTLAERGRLGDFHIVREIGRGGMGIVYEAEQISPGRRVALKVLPFATALNARQLRRFQNEAQAAAHLHHTNIVPVHAVGCDRGIHYFAMQFIEGRTMASMIEELRQLNGRIEPVSDDHSDDGAAADDGQTTQPHYPQLGSPFDLAPPSPTLETHHSQVTLISKKSQKDPSQFQTIARLGVQAAEALEHAHQMGIVHRDIKPANLLVDDRGHLWITDFGLARCQGEGGLTLTGDLLGTLRYMSPEQALAKRVRVTHQTDVYSLGVTLYEMSTLEPAYNGRDRQEILKQIAFEDPRPPRRINPDIPVELETIVLKAMDKEPESRYATAQEMADDLRRFLEQRPILAKRPTLREHLRKWALRHKQLVYASVGLFCVSALACSLLFWYEERQTDRAMEKLKEAHTELQITAARAERARLRAESYFGRLSGGVVQMLRQVESTRWADVDEIDEIRQALTQELLTFCRGYLKELSADPEARHDQAATYLLMGNLNRVQADRVQGAAEQAEKDYRKAVEFFESVANQYPNQTRYRFDLGMAYFSLALHLASIAKSPAEIQKAPEIDEVCRKALENYSVAADAPCCWSEGRAHALNAHAWFLSICPITKYRDPKTAIELVNKAIALQPEIATFWNTLGVARYRSGDWQGAIHALEKSMKMHQGGDGFDWFFLAMAYWQMHDEKNAWKWYKLGKKELPNTNTYMEPVWPYYCEAAALLGDKSPEARRPTKPAGQACHAVHCSKETS